MFAILHCMMQSKMGEYLSLLKGQQLFNILQMLFMQKSSSP